MPPSDVGPFCVFSARGISFLESFSRAGEESRGALAGQGGTFAPDVPRRSHSDGAVRRLAGRLRRVLRGRYLTRHGFSREGRGVTTAYKMATDRPARVTDIRLTLRVPGSLPAERWPALRSVVAHCTIHNSIPSAQRSGST